MTETATEVAPRLIECVVKGNKTYHGSNLDGSRYIAKPGDHVRVTAAQLTAFPHRLTTPELAELEMETSKQLAIANRRIAELTAAAMRPPRPPGAVEAEGQGEAEGVGSDEGEGEGEDEGGDSDSDSDKTLFPNA